MTYLRIRWDKEEEIKGEDIEKPAKAGFSIIVLTDYIFFKRLG
jgi:hypothetical protein